MKLQNKERSEKILRIDTIQLRKKIGSKFLSQKEFYKAMGRSESYISRLLTGKVVETVDLKTIYKMIAILNLTDNEIISIFFSKREINIL